MRDVIKKSNIKNEGVLLPLPSGYGKTGAHDDKEKGMPRDSLSAKTRLKQMNADLLDEENRSVAKNLLFLGEITSSVL